MLTKKHTKSTDKPYEAFVRDVELSGMGLNSLSCHLDRAGHRKLRNDKQTPVRKIAISYELEEVGSAHFDVLAKYTLTEQDRRGRSKPLVIECVFGTHFHGPEPVKRDHAEQFAKSFLPVLVWPYFRQLVFDSTARMAIPPLTLPLLPEG